LLLLHHRMAHELVLHTRELEDHFGENASLENFQS
jgi:hypothetical protein